MITFRHKHNYEKAIRFNPELYSRTVWGFSGEFKPNVWLYRYGHDKNELMLNAWQCSCGSTIFDIEGNI